MQTLPNFIALDLDNTVYDYDSCNEAGLKAVFDHLSWNFKVSPNDGKRYFNIARANVKSRLHNTASSHSRILYFKNMLELMRLPNLLELSSLLEQIYWGNYLRSMRRADGSMNLLEVARENAIPVVVMTNLTTQIQIRKLAQLEMFDYLTGLITSEEVGVDKPNSAFFLYAEQFFGLGEGHWWVIGDDDEKDKKMAHLAKSAEFIRVRRDFGGRPTLTNVSEGLKKLCLK